MKKTLTLDEKNILKYFGIDLNEFYKSSAKEQKTIISILNKFYSYHLLSEEIKKDRNNSWNSLEIRQGLKYLRETKREIESELGKIKLKNSNEYKELNELNKQVLSEIEELNDLYKEAISPNQNTSSPEPESNSDKIKQKGILTNFIDGLKEGFSFIWKITLLIIVILIVIGGILYFLLPTIGKCVQDENILKCYIRISVDKKIIEDFNLCQDSCGRGIGNEICLEKCEIDYHQGKYKLLNKYTTSTGKIFECPPTTRGYEDKYGNPVCRVN